MDGKFLDGKMLAKMFKGGAARLRSNADTVNNLNVFPVPDGDTGDNMTMTMEGGVAAIDRAKSESLTDVMNALAQGMLLGARGNSGVILSQFFAGMAKGFETYEKANAQVVAKALKMGVEQAYSSVITPTEGTILTVAREAVDYAVDQVTPESTLQMLFADLIKEMYESLQRTPEILAVLKEAGVIDSGGAGLFYIMEGFNKILQGEEIEDSAIAAPKAAPVDTSSFDADSEMVYAYCTEALLQLQNKKCDPQTFDVDTVKNYLVTIGDSIVAFKTGSIIKMHVHTMTPYKVLEFCQQFGEFLTIKIENMNVQHHESVAKETEAGQLPEVEKKAAHKKYATIAVASGDGIKDVFVQLGIDRIVDGGQTQNPSANDFLSAFDEVNADNIFVLPNNGNIILAARQAAELYKKAHVEVLESKNLGMGYAAACALNYEDDDPDKIAAMLTEAMSGVKTGQISPSIRDANLNGVQIHNGDFIGFMGKEMLAASPDKVETTKQLLGKMGTADCDVVTVFCGKDAMDEETKAISDYLEATFPDVEAYFVKGGQDVYSFIFVLE